MFDKTLTFLDTETTGTNFQDDRIIEIGMIKVLNNEIIDAFSSLVNPHTDYLRPFISYLTGIHYAELEDAPDFESLADHILDFTEGTTVVAHNARFDWNFLTNEFARYDRVFQRPVCCSVVVSRSLYPQYKKHSLSEIIKRFNIKCENRHRALDDAAVIHKFFNIVRKKHPKKKLNNVFTNSIFK